MQIFLYASRGISHHVLLKPLVFFPHLLFKPFLHLGNFTHGIGKGLEYPRRKQPLKSLKTLTTYMYKDIYVSMHTKPDLNTFYADIVFK